MTRRGCHLHVHTRHHDDGMWVQTPSVFATRPPTHQPDDHIQGNYDMSPGAATAGKKEQGPFGGLENRR